MNTVQEFLGLFSLLHSQNNGIYNVCVAFVLITAGAELVLNIYWNEGEKKREKTGRGQQRDKERKKETKKIEESSCT